MTQLGAARLEHRSLGAGLLRPRGRRRLVQRGFRPAAEIAKDGDDAVVRVELPGVDVEKDVNVEVEGQLVIHGERRDERA